MNDYCLYWIHYPDQTDPNSEGYIGITSDFESRITTHSKYAKYKHIYNRMQSGAIPEVLWKNLTKEEAELLEARMRPTENIGWNLAAGGNIPPSRAGKVSLGTLLTGDDRTPAQKESARKHKIRMQGRLPANTTPIEIFGMQFQSVNQALRELKMSQYHYYFYKNNPHLTFNNTEELREHTKSLKHKKRNNT